MFSRNVRWLLVAAAGALGIIVVRERPGYAALLLIAAALLAAGHYRHGTVWLAFQAQRRGKTERAQRLLREIADPERLTRRDRAYYHLLVGVQALESGAHEDAYAALTRVELPKLRTDNDRSLAEVMLAGAALSLEDRERATLHLERARGYPCRAEIRTVIDQMDAEISGTSAGQ